eukprot:8748-Heterococcus_DN1.PRE.2
MQMCSSSSGSYMSHSSASVSKSENSSSSHCSSVHCRYLAEVSAIAVGSSSAQGLARQCYQQWLH